MKPRNTARKRREIEAWLANGYGAQWTIERVEREGQQWPNSFASTLLMALTRFYGWRMETHYEPTTAGRSHE